MHQYAKTLNKWWYMHRGTAGVAKHSLNIFITHIINLLLSLIIAGSDSYGTYNLNGRLATAPHASKARGVTRAGRRSYKISEWRAIRTHNTRSYLGRVEETCTTKVV
jgi:hypothetical protein